MSGVNLLEQATLIHKTVHQEGLLNISRATEISMLAAMLSDTFQHFSQSISKESKSFFKKLKDDQQEHDSIVFLNQFVGDMVREISSLLSSMSKQIRSTVVEPLGHFISNLQETNAKLQEDSLQNINRIESNTSLLRDVEKSFKEAQAKAKLLRQRSFEVQQQEQLYRQQLAVANDTWGEIQANYRRIMKEFDMSNESRCVFTRNVQIRLVRILNQVVSSDKIESAMKEHQRMPYANRDFSETVLVKVEVECGHSQLLRERVVEAELPELNLQQQTESTYERNCKDIETFAEMFVNRTNIKSNTAFDEVRTLILENEKWTEYFLSNVSHRLFTEINLPENKYNELLAIAKYLFASAAEGAGNYSILYSLLWIAVRVHHNGDYLIHHINRNKDFWRNEEVWVKMLCFLKEQTLKKERSMKGYIRNIKKIYSKGIINRGLKKLGMNKYTVDEKQFKDEEEQLTFDSLREMNVLIARLEIGHEETLGLLVTLCRRFHLSKANMENLVRYQYLSRKSQADREDARAVKKHRQQHLADLTKPQRLIKVVKLSLRFLPAREVFRLLQVNKFWWDCLRIPVYRRFLQHEPHLSMSTRLQVYTSFIPKKVSSEVYQKMLKEMGGDHHPFYQVINLDVRRSLGSRPELQPQLRDMLLAFSYYNSSIGYVQGMNYQGEHILKLTTDKTASYAIFEYLLTQNYTGIFGEDFDGLKLKFYQFGRLLERNLPQLAKHFFEEKVEGQHYLVSWAITLWGQFPGDVVWLMWDGFLTDGWRWWMKCCLWVLSVFQAEFLTLHFEDILKLFSESGNNEFFLCRWQHLANLGLTPSRIKQEVADMPVSNYTLKLLEKEYMYSVKKFKEFVGSTH